MLSFIDYLEEVRLSRITRSLERGDDVVTLSPERGDMSKEQKSSAHKKMQSRLSREQKKGRVTSWSGPHSGEYQYADPKPGEAGGVSKEGSYEVRFAKGSKAGKYAGKTGRQLGKSFGQESITHSNKGPSGKAKMRLVYTGGENKGRVDKLGNLRYNRKMTTGSGRTRLKSGGSFTAGE
jgi:hypothetical protein